MTKARVNIRCRVNNKNIRSETRNGRKVIVVPSATLPDNVVMNGVMYPANEIEKSYHTLERTPAPVGHPFVNGRYVSSLDPEGLNVGYIGAWNENVQRVDGRVTLDKVIDVEYAERCENGKKVLEAIEKGDPIHTSTGVMLMLKRVDEDSHQWVAADMVFDHDAILLDQEGAATPDQGVGMLVNEDGIMVINSSLEENLDDQMHWALESIARTLEQKQRLPMLERIKAVLVEAFQFGWDNPRQKETADMAKEDDQAALETRLNAFEKSFGDFKTSITDSLSAINESLKGLPAITDKVNALDNANKAAEDAKKANLVNKAVEAGVLTKESAETLTVNALEELAAKAKLKPAYGLNSSFSVSPKADEFEGYSLNALIDGDK